MSTAWKTPVRLMVSVLINDLESSPTYSDARIDQVAVVAAQFVNKDITLGNDYTIDVVGETISPDPSVTATKDELFINSIVLKASCIIDQSTFRTKAALEGLRAQMGPASMAVRGNLAGYQILLKEGPCALYYKFVEDYEIANATNISAILSPFVGNKFDPYMLPYSDDRYRSMYH